MEIVQKPKHHNIYLDNAQDQDVHQHLMNEKYLVIVFGKLKLPDAVYCRAAISGNSNTAAKAPAKREYPINLKVALIYSDLCSGTGLDIITTIKYIINERHTIIEM